MRTLFTWIMVSIVLFICPGPSFWYGFLQGTCGAEAGMVSFLAKKVQFFLIHIEENKEAKQLFAHFILMTVCAYFFSKELSIRISVISFNSWSIIIITMLFVLLFSFLIELMQSLLPVSFERGFDWMDIVFSLMGGLLGGIITLVVNRR